LHAILFESSVWPKSGFYENTDSHRFDGRQYSSDQISRMYNVDLYPTLVFFDANGREVSQRIVGITVLEYVAGELEKAIDAAVQDIASAL
jgi:hypothetical protein